MGKIDLTEYKQKVADGLWELIQNDKGIAIKSKKFNPETGEEVGFDFTYINVEDITSIKETALKSAENLGQLLVDIEDLP